MCVIYVYIRYGYKYFPPFHRLIHLLKRFIYLFIYLLNICEGFFFMHTRRGKGREREEKGEKREEASKNPNEMISPKSYKWIIGK